MSYGKSSDWACRPEINLKAMQAARRERDGASIP